METEGRPIAGQVDQHLAEAVAGREWLVGALDGRGVDPASVSGDELLDGLLAVMGALADSVNLLADELDRRADRS